MAKFLIAAIALEIAYEGILVLFSPLQPIHPALGITLFYGLPVGLSLAAIAVLKLRASSFWRRAAFYGGVAVGPVIALIVAVPALYAFCDPHTICPAY